MRMEEVGEEMKEKESWATLKEANEWKGVGRGFSAIGVIGAVDQ